VQGQGLNATERDQRSWPGIPLSGIMSLTSGLGLGIPAMERRKKGRLLRDGLKWVQG